MRIQRIAALALIMMFIAACSTSGSGGNFYGNESNYYQAIHLNTGFGTELGFGRAGGPVDGSQYGNTAHGPCRGRIDDSPDHYLYVQDSFSAVRFRAYSEADTTLVIRAPDGSYLCNDDAVDRDPQLTAALKPGEYRVYIGNFTGDFPDYRLEITNTGGAGMAQFDEESQRIEISEAIYFRSGSAEIDPRSHEVLDAVVDIMKSHSQIKRVRIEGHTDNQGERDYNIQLSQSRAEAVRAYLVNAGINADRLSARGYGPDEPIADNDNAEGREINRRVEFHVQSSN
jgi:outer membrane protein OmpA-like peptidoglycan-associated protein